MIGLRNKKMTYQEIGDHFGITRQRIQQILKDYKLPQHIKDEWRVERKEHWRKYRIEYHKKWRGKNREYYNQYRRKYYRANRERILECAKKWYLKNRDERLIKMRKYNKKSYQAKKLLAASGLKG